MTSLPTINRERLWQRHMEMAALGATPKGGVCRLAMGDEDIAAHKLLKGWADARGFSVEIDLMGNMFIRRAGTEPGLAPVASGSHSDTQPTGGRFDGIFGVLAAFEALETIDEAGIRTRRPVEAIVWNNEEGARFPPGVMGSAVYAGVLPLEAMLATRDRAGVTMGEEVDRFRAAMPGVPVRPLKTPIAAFVEAHIEQGPILEANGNQIGIVTGMQGNRRFNVVVTGEDAHSGTTPISRRKDALQAALRCVQALNEHFHDPEDVLRFTIGRFEVHPGAVVVVPGRVFFTVDFRHPNPEVLKRLGDAVAGICAGAVAPCTVEVTETSNAEPTEFPEEMLRRIERAAAARSYRQQRIYSGAGHDARYMAMLCPTAMVFIPCWRGLSHNEAERAEPADCAAGAQVIADVLVDLAETI